MHEVEVKGILSASNGMNLYRGCSHGCIYCDARSKCYNFDHPFEDIEVKINAPQLLERALKSKRHKCMIGTGSMCDPYIHLEEKLGLTRRCLELIDQYGYGLTILTKSSRILRDFDLITSINSKSKAVVQMTMTTYDDDLCKIIEPNVSVTSERFRTMEKFKEAGVPLIVWLTPILPYINDTEDNIRGLLDYCVKLGVKGIITFGVGLTLREGDREYYYAALDRHFPGLKDRYIREYGNAYELSVPNCGRLYRIIEDTCKKHGIMYNPDDCFAYMREYPEKYTQLNLFDLL